MTVKEFSNQFDILYNNIMSNQAPGLDEYEKSVFLTEAEEQLVLAYYGSGGIQSFEKTEEVRRYLSELVATKNCAHNGSGTNTNLDTRSEIYVLPADLWFITYEVLITPESSNKCKSKKEIQVVPVTQDDFYKTRENPFKGPNDRRALRLDLGNNKVEIVSAYPSESVTNKYIIRYVKKVEPIILADLPTGISIKGVSTAQTCKLHEALHRTILELAVKLAAQSYKGTQS